MEAEIPMRPKLQQVTDVNAEQAGVLEGRLIVKFDFHMEALDNIGHNLIL